MATANMNFTQLKKGKKEDVISQEYIKIASKYDCCPFCDSKNTKNNSTIGTMIGYEKIDMNHYWENTTCLDCHKKFTRERRADNVWFSQERSHGHAKSYVMRGISSCFEPCVYNCNECNGKVFRKETDLEGEDSTSRMIDASGRNWRTFYYCEDCYNGVEVEGD